MPMPIWWGQINKRIFNPRALKGDKWSVIHHVGRKTGNRYRTPLEAHEVEGGFVFIMVYGPKTDWAQNVLVAGSAELEYHGETLALEGPRKISKEAAQALLPETTKAPPAFLNITDYLQMDRAIVRDPSRAEQTSRVNR
jgi:deazaflavin-dependent oxidoreductase (nitroreductase family)